MLSTKVFLSKLTKAISVPILCAIFMMSVVWAAEAMWCSIPRGIAIQEFTFNESSRDRMFSQRLTQNKPYLYVARIEGEQQLRAFARASNTSYETIRRNVEPSHPYWYIYSNARGFASHEQIRNLDWDAKKGAVLQLDREGENLLTSNQLSSSDHPLSRFIADLDVKTIIVRGNINIENTAILNSRNRPPIFRINDNSSRLPSNANDARLIMKLNEANPDKFEVLNLLPLRRRDALDWGFYSAKAEFYATNGRRISKDLSRYGFSPLPRGIKKGEIINKLSIAAREGKTILIIGEATNDGRAVRLPGMTDTISRSDISPLPGEVDIIGLVCNSQHLLEGTNSLATIGTIQASDARNVLKVIFGANNTRRASTINISSKENQTVATVGNLARSFSSKGYTLSFVKFPSGAISIADDE